MKKVLATVAALGLVAGVATTASALDLSVTGVYNVTGTSMNEAIGSGVVLVDDAGNADEGTDSWYEHTFKMLPTMKVNDNVSMKADIRFAKATVWGSQEDLATSSGGNFNVHKIYMEYMSPVGKIRIGRAEGGAWEGAFLNSSTNADRIMWWPSMVSGAWSLMLMTEKKTENDSIGANSHSDSDLYKASLSHKSANGKAAIAYNYTVDGTPSTATPPVQKVKSNKTSKVELAANYKIADINFAMEAAHQFGDKSADANTDYDASALYLHADKQLGDLNIGATYVYASGDEAGGTDNEAFMGTSGLGKDFNPLLILTGDDTGLLNGDTFAADADMVDDGVHMIGLFANYKASDKLTLNAAIAYAMADEEKIANQDDDYGVEYNVGAAYKLLDNLTYEVHLGYLDTGDYFQEGVSGQALHNVTLLTNSLTMTF
ncbi:MAG: hypothetical protein OEY01_13610 [Desulfobulbaceae bacterium]|nr:hypothetical protein [Desulfobulbaceae bacterium]HIJ79766.1 hypothetical protein [Deltaproteobacteria bacterium]